MKNSILIQENNFEKARKKIQEAKKINKKAIFFSNNDDLNRKIIEKSPPNILLLNQSNRKDFQKQRNSGLNQVLAKIAKKNNIVIGIDLNEIINSKGKSKSDILARIRQNINLCKKNKLNIKFITLNKKTKKDIYSLKALGLVLKMPTWMTKNL
ncbi:MAG: hypothetical protein ACE5ES_03495 [Candidatus Nanoarchaeia archaeon]